MDQPQQIHRFLWQGIEIEVTYTPCRWDAIDHLEIEAIHPPRAPLPITKTGYHSNYMRSGTIETHGGDVVAQIVAWLNEKAAKPAWLAHVEASRQGELF